MIGEEMMNHLAFFNFKIPGQSMTLTRIALAACILSSKKQQDGISRLIYKSDLEKLKGKASTKKLDEILCSLWNEVQTVNLPSGYVCFGKACVRMILHTLSKEKIAKEETFNSFEEILTQFHAEVQGKTPAVPGSEASSSSVTTDPVKDLVNSCASEVALLQNTHIKVGDRYLCSQLYPDQVFVLHSIDENGAHFEHKPLFGSVVKHSEPLETLKQWKVTKKEMTQLCPPSLCQERLPHNSTMVRQEAERMQVNALLMEAYMANKPDSDDLLNFTCHPSNLVLMKKVKKKALQLFPVGPCSLVQKKDLHNILEKGKAVLVWWGDIPYQVQPFKTMGNFNKPDTDNGILCPFFWVKGSEDESTTNMTLSWVEFKHLKIPVLENQEAIPAETLLLRPDEGIAQEPPAKKAKAK